MPTKEQCIALARKVFTQGLYRLYASDPREAAEAAWIQGGPSVDELEVRIREMQAKARGTSGGEEAA